MRNGKQSVLTYGVTAALVVFIVALDLWTKALVTKFEDTAVSLGVIWFWMFHQVVRQG